MIFHQWAFVSDFSSKDFAGAPAAAHSPPPAPSHTLLKTMSTRREVESYFEEYEGRKILAKDSVVLFVSNNKVVNIGSISYRNTKFLAFTPDKEIESELASKTASEATHGGVKADTNAPSAPKRKASDIFLSVGVTFSRDSLRQVLPRLWGEDRNPQNMKEPIADFMIPASSTLFSYMPLLKCLQGRSTSNHS